MQLGTIFIQIASYRDPELFYTIKDCIENAKHPENLRFSIAWQHSKDDVWDNIYPYFDDPRFKIIDIPYEKSQGVCWARNLLQQNYNDEEYTLQLDSHHRFSQNWDEFLINELKKLQDKGYKKPLLTGYIPSYDPKNDPEQRLNEVWVVGFDRFSPEGVLHPMPHTIENWESKTEPIPARYYSAHFAFTLGQFVKEVPHDPNYYFHGEEISISVRAYTHGYDLFHLHKPIIWHYYTRKDGKRHWDDVKDWYEIEKKSVARNKKLFSIDGEKYDSEEFGIYGFGKTRSLHDYEKYAGVRFSDQSFQKYTLDKKDPPNPELTEEEYNKSFLKYFKHCIDIFYESVPYNDYDLWAVAFEDENGNELIRLDAYKEEIDRMKNDPDNYCKLWRSFYPEKKPYKWIVWPHSIEHGWTNKLEGILYEKKDKVITKIDPPKEIPSTPNVKSKNDRIFVHLPAYREPELIPTIKNALENAADPSRIVFGICRQYNPDDKFDNVDEYRSDPRFKIIDIPYKEAKGLAYARAKINDELLEDEEFVLQLDSHHRFTKDWDNTLINWYYDLKSEGHNPLICGYLPYYNPYNDPAERVQEPWLSQAACFYPHGTIFIRPVGIRNWQELTKPYPARFLSGHFCFGPNKWAKEVRHDPNIFFSGEELNLTVRSYTHGYDLFHPHRVVIWHATMREERAGMLVWDDQHKRGETMWWKQQDIGRARIRQLIGVEDNGYDLEPWGLGNVRTIRDYEKYAGIHFKKKAFQQHTIDNQYPPNPTYNSDKEWEESFIPSFYHLVNIERRNLPEDDYDFIYISFDDVNNNSIKSKIISGDDLLNFLNNKGPIHYEEFFPTHAIPQTLVAWAHSEKRGWVEKFIKKL